MKQLNSSGSSGSPASVASSRKEVAPSLSAPAQALVHGAAKPALRGIIPVTSDGRGTHSPADSVSEITAGRELNALKISAATVSTAAPPPTAEIQPCE